MKAITIENGKQTNGYMMDGTTLKVIRDLGEWYSQKEIEKLAAQLGATEITIFNRERTGVTSESYALINGEWKNGYYWCGEFKEA